MEAPCPEIEVFHDLTQDRSTSMTEQATSPLRRRMIEDMTMRKLAPKTQHHYVQRVKDFAAFLGRSPATASKEDVREVFGSPAPGACGAVIIGPASENLHRSRPEQVQQRTPYSITSSARTSREGGALRPSAFAALRLRTV